MRIIVDGDGCSGRESIEKVAKEYSIPLYLYCDINHSITLNYGEVIVCDSHFQSVDMVIFNKTLKNDIVVTQDYGVAAMVLSKGAYAISPTGFIYEEDNIDRLLFERHIKSKVRRGGGKIKGPRKRNKEDDDRLYNTLRDIITKGLQ